VPERKRPESVILSQRVTIEETSGPVEVTLDLFGQGDDGLSTLMSFSLKQWVERLGGYIGDFTDDEEPSFIYPVSLEEWRSRDPEGTWLMMFAVVQYRLRGRGHHRIHSVRPLRPE
jgi:hypothetical protein